MTEATLEGWSPEIGPDLSLAEVVDKAFDYLERMIGKLHERIEKFQERHAHGDGSAL